MAAKNAISSMYVTSAILKGIKADATEIFMNKKKRIFSFMPKNLIYGSLLVRMTFFVEF